MQWLIISFQAIPAHDAYCTRPGYRGFRTIHQIKSDGQIKEFRSSARMPARSHPAYRLHAFEITEVVRSISGAIRAWLHGKRTTRADATEPPDAIAAHCERAFQSWLSHRFKDISRLNEAWGTAFSGASNTMTSPKSHCPAIPLIEGAWPTKSGLLLDFFRFSSDVQVSFNRELADIIRASSPSRPVTHNLMGAFTDINYFDLARDLDVVSWDNYPFFQPQTAHQPPSPLPHDLMRGLKSRNVWVMEQASGPGGWDRFYSTPEPAG